jgi:GNAT superfamily N-acetyltransferase
MGTLSPDGVVEEFLDQWGNSDLRGKMQEPQVIANGPVVELTLIAVYELHQDKGYASRALQMLTTLGDENQVAISLVARPMGRELSGCAAGRSLNELIDWYTRHGFVDTTAPGDDTRTMVREPRKGARA